MNTDTIRKQAEKDFHDAHFIVQGTLAHSGDPTFIKLQQEVRATNTPAATHPNRENSSRQPAVSKSSEDLIVALRNLLRSRTSSHIDCPVYKHHVMHGSTPPCQGCTVKVMSQVRSHLNPSRSMRHRGFPSFIEQCARCKRDFVDRQVYQVHKDTDCVPRPQTRGDVILPWTRQYFALYPHASRVPRPCRSHIKPRKSDRKLIIYNREQ